MHNTDLSNTFARRYPSKHYLYFTKKQSNLSSLLGPNSSLRATDCTSCALKPVVSFVCQFSGFQEMFNPATPSVRTVLASKFKLKLDRTINQLQKCPEICLKQDI